MKFSNPFKASASKRSQTPKTLTDRRGREIPIESVRPYQLEENYLTEELMERAVELEQELRTFKHEAMKKMISHKDRLRKHHGLEPRGEKGNQTITTYDGKEKVEIRIAEFITFTSELYVAKELIDNCLERWASDSGKELRTIIQDTFKTDKHDRVNTRAILALRQYDFDDPDWKKAMDIIQESVTVTSSKSYLRFQTLDEQTEQYETRHLNIAKV